jgi:hypothetical protein
LFPLLWTSFLLPLFKQSSSSSSSLSSFFTTASKLLQQTKKEVCRFSVSSAMLRQGTKRKSCKATASSMLLLSILALNPGLPSRPPARSPDLVSLAPHRVQTEYAKEKWKEDLDSSEARVLPCKQGAKSRTKKSREINDAAAARESKRARVHPSKRK